MKNIPEQKKKKTKKGKKKRKQWLIETVGENKCLPFKNINEMIRYDRLIKLYI